MLDIWNKLKDPPKWALKEIKAGRLKGKTDISPQWRYQAMTEQFGPCGIGWKFEKVRQWTEEAPENQRLVFVDINLYIKVDGQWSDSIPGTGGDKVLVKESSGLYLNDEAYSMALTDALGKAMKMIGVAATVYCNMPATKYNNQRENTPVVVQDAPQPPKVVSYNKTYTCETEGCGAKVEQNVYDWSVKHFNKRILCRKCQGKAKEASA